MARQGAKLLREDNVSWHGLTIPASPISQSIKFCLHGLLFIATISATPPDGVLSCGPHLLMCEAAYNSKIISRAP
jgi:hypothetical protein